MGGAVEERDAALHAALADVMDEAGGRRFLVRSSFTQVPEY